MVRAINVRQHQRRIAPNKTTSVVKHKRCIRGQEMMLLEADTPVFDEVLEARQKALKKWHRMAENRELTLKISTGVAIGLLTAEELGLIDVFPI